MVHTSYISKLMSNFAISTPKTQAWHDIFTHIAPYMFGMIYPRAFCNPTSGVPTAAFRNPIFSSLSQNDDLPVTFRHVCTRAMALSGALALIPPVCGISDSQTLGIPSMKCRAPLLAMLFQRQISPVTWRIFELVNHSYFMIKRLFLLLKRQQTVHQ